MKKIFLIVVLTLSFASANRLEKVSLQLKWKYQFQFAGFIMAKEKGFYKDVGLDVDLLEFNTQTDMVDDVQKGKVEFAINDSSLVLEVMKGKPVVAMMNILQHTPYGLMGLRSSGIKSLEDINGKKIALYDNLNGLAINAMLASHNINYKKNPIAYTLETLINGKNDLQTVYLSNEPYVAKEMGLDVVVFNPKDYGFDGYGDILFTSKAIAKNRPELVEKMYEASKKGWEYAFSHIDETADVIWKKYNTLNKTKNALMYEGKTLKSLSGYGENFGEINEEKIKNIAQIFSFMNKGKNNFENLKGFIYKPTKKDEDKKSLFTQEELAYIKTKKTVKVCGSKEQFPFIIFNEKDVSGISMEYLKQIADKSHLNFEIVKAETIPEHFKMIQEGRCDVSAIVMTKPNMHDFLIPTNPSGSDTIVMVTKINEPYIDDLNNLKNKKIAVARGSKNLIHYVKTYYPNMNIEEVDNFSLDKVTSGEFYGAVGASYQLSYKIASQYFNELKIMSKIGDKKISGSFGITVREPILLSIFNKSLDAIPQLEKEKINNVWLSVKIEKQFDYSLVWQISLVSLVIILIYAYLNIQLRREIKRRKETEVTLKQSEAKFRTLFDIAPILIDSFDENGRCALWNKECERLFGWTIEEINKAENPIALFYPDAQVQKDVIESITTEPRNVFREWHPMTKYGKEVITMWANVSLPNDEIISIGYDITELRQTELELKSKTIELEKAKSELSQLNTTLIYEVELQVEANKQQQLMMIHQNRLAQMGEMISMIAHQWRQPLNTLAILTQTIVLKYKRGKLNDTIVDSFKENSKKQIHQMSNTIDDFRDFFKPEKVKTDFCINRVVFHVIDILKPAFEINNIDIKFEEEAEFNIVGYPNELGQAILNIISNAKDALLDNKVEGGKINIILEQVDNSIVLSIGDNAGGISDEIIAKIFDPYFSTKLEKNGTGLGLYMTKMIIEEHIGGVLSVKNDDNGAIFKICFMRG